MYDNLSHKNPIFGQLLKYFMPKIMFTADMVIFANFRFRHDHSKKISLKMGLNLIFNYKKLLGTLKVTHLLYINKTFISKSMEKIIFPEFLAPLNPS